MAKPRAAHLENDEVGGAPVPSVDVSLGVRAWTAADGRTSDVREEMGGARKSKRKRASAWKSCR